MFTLLILFIILGIITIIIITLLFLIKKKKGISGEPDYKVFFIIGLAWIPIGSVFINTINPVMGIAFIGLGICYLAIGLANKNKWK